MNKYDIVVLKEDCYLDKGTKGIIVYIYGENLAYEVEFPDGIVLTLKPH